MRRLGTFALAALVAGVITGLAAARTGVPASVAGPLAWLVRAWTQALASVAVPLALAQFFLAVAKSTGARTAAAKLGLYVPVVIAGLLVLAVAVTVPLTVAAMHLPGLDALSLPPVGHAEWSQPAPLASLWRELLPQRILARALSGDLVAMLALTLAGALSVRLLGPRRRAWVVKPVEVVSAVAYGAVRLLLLAAPAVVFAVAFGTVRTSGLQIGVVLAANAALKIVVTLAVVAAIYGAVAAVRIPIGAFASAVLPGQMVALATRSSLASLPALMTGARERLGLDAEISGGLLGFAGAAVKLSGPVSSTFKFLFLASVLGVHLSPAQVGAFVATILATSATTVGIPQVSVDSTSLAFYAAAGMPLEYVMLLGTVVALTDPVSTMLNSTAYLAFTAVVCRLGLGPVSDRAAVAPVPQTAG